MYLFSPSLTGDVSNNWVSAGNYGLMKAMCVSYKPRAAFPSTHIDKDLWMKLYLGV